LSTTKRTRLRPNKNEPSLGLNTTEEKQKEKPLKETPKSNPLPKSKKPKGEKPIYFISEQEKQLIEHYTLLPDVMDSRFVAFMKAGYKGGKKACNKLFEQDRIRLAINEYREEHLTILHPDDDPYHTTTHRNSQLTETITRIIEKCIANGMTQTNAALVANLNSATVTYWLNKGRDKHNKGKLENRYAKFYNRILSARAKGEALLLSTISDAAFGSADTDVREIIQDGKVMKREVVRKRDWKSAAWLLERTRANKYYVHPGFQGQQTAPDTETTKEKAQKDAELLKLLLNTDKPENSGNSGDSDEN